MRALPRLGGLLRLDALALELEGRRRSASSASSSVLLRVGLELPGVVDRVGLLLVQLGLVLQGGIAEHRAGDVLDLALRCARRRCCRRFLAPCRVPPWAIVRGLGSGRKAVPTHRPHAIGRRIRHTSAGPAIG